MEVGRKRLRTDVDDRSRQQKYLVTSRLVEQNDKILMQKVYEKTLSMMFSGSRQRKSLESVENDGEILDKTLEDKIEDKLPTNSLGCKLCLKDIDTSLNNSICSCCNLKICEACKEHCSYCSKSLCVNCVNIFGCSIQTDDFATPICEDCKSFVD
ncbi:unnamed protein product [Chironomus riparius]|uniref:Apoptosis regulatory protein Siva n=1 Tax=Chironomus riparius TaxID=315576 RepID=A0A9N9RM64_9DIPT|nr:unnamed protein product [Chironomus riparius]